MINLLPNQYKIELKQEENFKLILILAILFLIFLISFSLVLFSIKFLISGEVEAQKIIYAQKEEEFKNSKMQILEENILLANEKLSKLNYFYKNQGDFSGALEKILASLPPSVSLANLSINLLAEQRMECSLSGFAPTRQLLLELKENLEREQRFEEVYFPSSSWTEPTNINFSIRFKIK